MVLILLFVCVCHVCILPKCSELCNYPVSISCLNVKSQTRAREWLFFSEEGQWMVVRSSKAARLIMVLWY